MAYSLQHRQAAQLIGLSPACTRKHRSDGPEAHDALTIKMDHPMGARQTLWLLLTIFEHTNDELAVGFLQNSPVWNFRSTSLYVKNIS
jgi:hypothetical protein